MPENNREWLVWSNEHLSYWLPYKKGYTGFKTKAGRYTFAEALSILAEANGHLKDGDEPCETMLHE